ASRASTTWPTRCMARPTSRRIKSGQFRAEPERVHPAGDPRCPWNDLPPVWRPWARVDTYRCILPPDTGREPLRDNDKPVSYDNQITRPGQVQRLTCYPGSAL